MSQNLIKSKKRVKDFAEVYTPEWLVKDMVALTDASVPYVTVLEPACGNGNFLAEILRQKLSNCKSLSDVQASVESLFGVDIQEDNIEECRERLHGIVVNAFPDFDKGMLKEVLGRHILCGNFLTRKKWSQGRELDELIWFLGDGK